MSAVQECFHCGLEVPPHTDFTLTIDGQPRRFCCVGCQAVASAIVDGGLENFYRFRSENNNRPQDKAASFAVYDLPEVQSEFVYPFIEPGKEQTGTPLNDTQLLLEGISCAACVWLIERHLEQVPGIESVRVNASTHRCLVRWQPEQVKLSEIMASLSQVGYQPIPATKDQQQLHREKENRTALMRMGVAGFGMMQVGMAAVGLYYGAEAEWEHYLRWFGLIVSVPVVVYSAKPFYTASWNALRMGRLIMDVPVALAIISAFLLSCWATVMGIGEVYFDSVTMFTFLLLVGRYLEMRARHRNGVDTDRLAQLLPATADKQAEDGTWLTVPLSHLMVGDRVLVASGTSIPCDGRVLAGRSGVVETLLTGEPDAVEKQLGDEVIAGTLNTDSALQIEVTAVGQGTRLSAIERLVEQAQHDKPTQVAMADKLSSYFVAGVLIISALVFTAWWFIDSSKAVWITLSVLVVTCPCALALAAPTALTAAVSWLRQQGLLITRGHVLESLPKIKRVIFDKTGTLTLGAPQVVAVVTVSGEPLSEAQRTHYLGLCAALETGSTHPVAKAFLPYQNTAITASDVRQETGQGVEGVLAGQTYRLGKPEFVHAELTPPPAAGQWLLLGDEQQPLLWICLQDALRESAAPLIAALKARGLAVELLSGDGEAEVARVAAELGFGHWQSRQSPSDKLAYIQQVQEQGDPVLMVGDGINDVPVLSGAFVSVAMGGATDLAQTQADSVLLGRDLMAVERAFICARFTRRIIRQNLFWSLFYNITSLPAAAVGLVPPWVAAVGMSTSSLVVVGNALRINYQKPQPGSKIQTAPQAQTLRVAE